VALEDEEPRKPVQASVPRPLAGLSVADLDAWIATLRLEIARVEAELAKRRDVKSAADALFRLPRDDD
jgi:uncharacterized small protein (DUF1192 family)